METEHVLTVDCAESPGIVHAVTGFLLDHGCDIIDTKQFGDQETRQFFMRVHFAVRAQAFSTEELRRDFEPVADEWEMNWQLETHGRKRRVLVMVSKFGHCLNDLLFRARIGDLPVEIVAVVSNHRDQEDLASGTASRSTTSPSPRRPSRQPRPGCWSWWTNSMSSSWSSPATCRS